MPSEYDKIRKFYKSDNWKIARAMKIASAGGRCEKCGDVGTDNPEISINQNNLLLLCKECHNKEHERFTDKKEYKFDEDGNMVKK